MRLDPSLDTGDAVLNALSGMSGTYEAVMRALFDLPDSYVIAEIEDVPGETVMRVTVGETIGGLIQGELDEDVVLRLLVARGAVRPTVGDIAGGAA